MGVKRTEKVAFCPSCAEDLLNKPPKAITKLVTICNGCGREMYCSLVLTKWLSPRKDIQLKNRRKK